MPQWAQRLAKKALAPVKPVRNAIYEAVADLPDPTVHRGCHAYVHEIPMMVFSNGVNWLRLDTGWPL